MNSRHPFERFSKALAIKYPSTPKWLDAILESCVTNANYLNPFQQGIVLNAWTSKIQKNNVWNPVWNQNKYYYRQVIKATDGKIAFLSDIALEKLLIMREFPLTI